MPEISSSGVSASSRAFSALLVFLVVSATYLYTFPQPNIFYAVIVLLHATTGVVAAVMLAIFFFRLLRNGSFAALAGLGYGARYVRESRWQKHARIENPAMPPANMSGEGDGPEGAFFPSSAQVYGKRKIPSKFFMESDSCKRCHQDIYNQWFSSA